MRPTKVLVVADDGTLGGEVRMLQDRREMEDQALGTLLRGVAVSAEIEGEEVDPEELHRIELSLRNDPEIRAQIRRWLSLSTK